MRLPLVFCLFLLANVYAWTKRNPLPTAGVILSVSYGNSLYVAPAFYSNTIEFAVSKDAKTWILGTIPNQDLKQDNVLNYIAAYGSSGWVAVGTPYHGGGGNSPAAIFLSQDGVKWRAHYNQTRHYFGRSLVFGGGTYVNTGGVNFLYSSRDGLSWTFIDLPSYSDGITYAYGVFYVFGFYGSINGAGYVVKSTDGFNWNVWDINIPEKTISRIYWFTQAGGGRFLMLWQSTLGDSHISISDSTGNTWRSIYQLPSDFSSGEISASQSGVYIATGYLQNSGNYIYVYSNDGGNTWQNATGLNSIPKYVGTKWVGTNPSIPGLIQYSDDGIHWNTYDNGIISHINNFIYYSRLSKFVLSTSDGIYTANPAVPLSWEKVSRLSFTLFKHLPGSNTIAAIANNTVFTSESLAQWTKVAALPTKQRAYWIPTWTGLLYVNGKWMASATIQDGFQRLGQIYIFDGARWTQCSTPSVTEIGSIVYGRGVYFASANRVLLSSNNSVDWYPIQTTTEYYGCSLKFFEEANNSPFFYVCARGNLYSSQDGKHFVRVNGLNSVQSLSYLPDAKEYAATGVNGELWISKDGHNYSAQTRINLVSPFDWVAEGKKVRVAVCAADNAIYTE